MLNLLYPPRCIFCNTIIPINSYNKLDLCNACALKIPWVKEPSCSKCGRGLENSGLCPDCSKEKHLYTKGWVALEYDESVKSAVYRFKYGNSPRAARTFAEIMYKAILNKDILDIKFDWIIPVPIHKNRRRKRGYNQSQLLAKHLSKKLDIPYKNILKRIKDTKPQSGLSPRERVNNIKGAFVVSKTEKFENKKILIIDDIYTTGSTIDFCAKTIIDTIGQNEIYYYILTSVRV